MLDRRPGDGEAVEGGGAAADLVEDDERARAGLVEDGGGLDHLDHEGGAAAGEIVGGADAAEQAVDDADVGRLRRHVGADLGEDGDERVLAEEGRLAGHVGAGDQPDVAGVVAVAGRDRNRWRRRRRRRSPRSACSTTGWRPPSIAKASESVDHRPAIVLGLGEHGEAGGDIEHGERLGDGAGWRRRSATTAAASSSKTASSIAQRAVGGAGDLRLEVGKLGGGEADGAGQRLAVDEAGIERRRTAAARRCWRRPR